MPDIQKKGNSHQENFQNLPTVKDRRMNSMSIQWVIIQHVLLEKELYLMNNISWNEGLQDALVESGILKIHLPPMTAGQGTPEIFDTELIRQTIDGIHHSMDPTKFARFCQILAQNGNSDVSETLWKSFKMAKSKGGAGGATQTTGLMKVHTMPATVSKENTSVLRGRLVQAKEEASFLREKVEEMEKDQNVMTHLVTKAMDFEDEVAVKLGTLQDTKNVLQSQLSQRDQGLNLWKKKEKEYRSELSTMQKRMDEMSHQIRTKDAEAERLKMQAQKQLKQIQVLQTKITAKTRHGIMDLPERVVIGNLKSKRKGFLQSSSKTPSIKLPTIVKVAGEQTPSMSSRMNNQWGSPTKLHRLYNSENNLSIGSNRLNISQPLAPIPASPSIVIDSELSKDDTDRDSRHSPKRRLFSSKYRTHLCHTCDKWLQPGKLNTLELPNMHLTIPAGALKSAVNVIITDVQNQSIIQEQINLAGLQDFVEPSLNIILQPHGLVFEKEVYLELRNQNISSANKLVVFHRDMNFFERKNWINITKECSIRTFKGNIVLTVGEFCAIQTFKILIPLSSSNGSPRKDNESVAVQLASVVSNILNGLLHVCEFHIFLHEFEQKLIVLCLPHSEKETLKKDILNKYFQQGLSYLTKGVSLFAMSHGDNLHFYFNHNRKLILKANFSIIHTKTGGQLFNLSVLEFSQKSENPEGSSKNQYNEEMTLPSVLNIHRYFSDDICQELCSIDLQSSSKISLPRDPSHASFAQAELNALYSGIQKKVLTTVDVRVIMEEMRKEEIFTIKENEEIISQKSPQTRTKVFLDKLTLKGLHGFACFCKSLEGLYPALLEDIRNSFSLGSMESGF